VKAEDPPIFSWLGVLILMVVTLALASVPFWSAAKAVVPSAFSDRITLSGLVLTVGGFGITIWQLLRTREASVAATKAVEQMRNRQEAFEEAQLCSATLTLVTEMESWHGFATTTPSKEAFVLVMSHCRRLQSALFELRARLEEKWTTEQRTTVQETITKLADAEKTIIRWSKIPAARRRRQPNLLPLGDALRLSSEMLTTLEVKLSRKASGRE
jgi:hypothetical protein